MSTTNRFSKKHFVSICLIATFVILSVSGCKTDPLSAGHLRVSTDTIIIHGTEIQHFEIENTGFKDCTFQISNHPTWLFVRPEYGKIKSDERTSINIAADTYHCNEALTGSALKDKFFIESDDDYIAITAIYIPDVGTTCQVPDTVCYPANVDNFRFAINNYGSHTLPYSITTQSASIQLPSPTGQVPPFGQAAVEVRLNSQQSCDEITLSININGQDHITRLMASNHTKIEAEVVDADYSKSTDMLVCALNRPSLIVYHPTSQTLNEIHLPDYPNCVTLSLDGTKAAVGHDKSISYVDLMSNMVICNRAVRGDVFDIALGPNQLAYFTSVEEQWNDIHYLDLSQPYSTEKTGGSIHGKTHITLHPSGKSLYIPISLSPESIEKYDIQEIDPDYVHETRFDEGHYIEGMLWHSDDGNRLFTRGLSVLRTSDNILDDLDFLGEIVLDGSIVFPQDSWRNKLVWLDHNGATQRIYLIPETEDYYYENSSTQLKYYIYIDDDSSLQPIGKIGLGDFIMMDGTGLLFPTSSLPKYVFSNSDGSKIHILSKPSASWIGNQWEIQTINVE